MESSSEVRASELLINKNRAAELGLPFIQRIENIEEFMEKRKTSTRGIQWLIVGLEKERNQCAEALTRMRAQLYHKMASKNLIKGKMLELQSNLKKCEDGPQKLIKCSDKPDLIERDVTTVLEQYNGQMKMVTEDISKREDDIKFVAGLHKIAVMNINDVKRNNL